MNDALKQKVNILYVYIIYMPNRYICTHFVSGNNNRDNKG